MLQDCHLESHWRTARVYISLGPYVGSVLRQRNLTNCRQESQFQTLLLIWETPICSSHKGWGRRNRYYFGKLMLSGFSSVLVIRWTLFLTFEKYRCGRCCQRLKTTWYLNLKDQNINSETLINSALKIEAAFQYSPKLGFRPHTSLHVSYWTNPLLASTLNMEAACTRNASTTQPTSSVETHKKR
jgi:hypothetical protein